MRSDDSTIGFSGMQGSFFMAKNREGEVECFLTHKEVAEILTERGYPTTSKVAWHLEKQAFRKIASHPIIRAIAEEMGLLASDESEPTSNI